MTEDADNSKIKTLIDIMAQLRDPDGGCPWDLEQNFASIAQYTIEEAYEVTDAIERQNYPDLKDELGDLLLQIVFHSQMAAEQNLFDFGDVVEAICDKMIRRHPHVFGHVFGHASGDKTISESGSVAKNWETIKADEREQKNVNGGALYGVARALPALARAQKIQKRAARVGFDWPDISGATAKLHEEIEELQVAKSDAERFEEFGDLLFAAVNMARHLDIDAEAALKAGTAKFENRFQAMEKIAGDSFSELSLDAKEQLWTTVKLRE
jgi:nucleoside triphosphate diphosphatase